MFRFLNKIILIHYVELAARLYVFVFLNIYGIGKMMGGQFHRRGSLPPEIAARPAGDLNGFDLTWLFFGYSPGYIYFIGFSQVIGAFLLLSNKTKLLGAAILIPVLLNIIVVDICYGIPAGAMKSAVIYLLLLLLMLALNKKQVSEVWAKLTTPAGSRQALSGKSWMIVLGMLVALYVLEVLVVR